MEVEAQSSHGETELQFAGKGVIQAEENGEVLVHGRSPLPSDAGNKEDGEEATSDGDFIKVDAQHLVSVASTTERSEELKSLEHQLQIVVKQLQASEFEKCGLKSEVDLANEELSRANKRYEELEIEQKRLKDELLEAEDKHSKQLETLQEALQAVEARHKELLDVNESLNALSLEVENSRKKAEELEHQLALSASKAREFEELSNERSSHAELQSKRALETEELLEVERVRVKEIENLLNKLQEEVGVLHEKIAKNSQVEEALATTSLQLTATQEKFEASKLQADDLEKKLSSTEDVVEELSQAQNIHKLSEEQLRVDLQSLEGLLSASKEDLQDKVTKIELIELKIQEEVEKREAVEASLKIQEESSSSFQEELSKLRIENQTLERNLEDIKTNLSVANDLIRELEEKLSQNEELEEKLKTLERILEESKTSTETAVQRNIELFDLIQSSNATEAELKAQLKELETQLEEVRKYNNKLDEELSLAEEKNTNAYKQIEELETNILEISSSLRRAEEENSFAESQLQAYKDKVGQLESSFNDSSLRNIELEDQLKNLTGKCMEHETLSSETHQRRLELEELAHVSHRKAEEAGKKVAELEQVLEAANLKTQELETQLIDAEAKHRDAEAEAKLHGNRVSEVSAELAALKATAARLEALVDESNTKEQNLTNLLDTLIEEKQKLEEGSFNLSERLAQADNLIETLNNELKLAQGELANAQKDLEDSTVREREIISKLKSAEELLEHHVRTAENATARNLELELLHENFTKESDFKLNEALASYSLKESESSELREKISFLEEQAALYEGKAIEASEKVASHKAELDANSIKFVVLENIIDDLRQKVSEAEVKADQSYSENELLLETNLKLKDELEAHQKKVNELHQQLSSIQADKEAVSEELASHVKTLAALTEEHSRGLKNQVETESHVKDTEAQLLDTLQKLSQIDAEARELNEKLFALETQARTHEEQARDANTVVEHQKIQLEESTLKLQTLESFIEETNLKATQYETDIKGLTENNLHLSKDLEKFEEKARELQTALDEAINEKEHLLVHIDSTEKKLQSQISLLMEENTELKEIYHNTKNELQEALARLEEHINENKGKEISLVSEVNNLRADLEGKAAVEARIKLLEEELLLNKSRHQEEIKTIQAIVDEKEAKLSSNLEEHSNILQERDLLQEKLSELQSNLDLAKSTIAAQDAEASEKLTRLSLELEELRNKPQKVTELEQKIAVLENKLVTSATQPVQQVIHDGFTESVVKGEVEVKTREIDFGATSTTSKRKKNKGKVDVLPAETSPTATVTTATATEPSGALALKFVLGVAIVSMIVGIILGKRY